ILTYNARPGGEVNPYGPLWIGSEGENHKILGTITYIKASDTFNGAAHVTTDWNVGANVPTQIKDVVLYSGKSQHLLQLQGEACSNCSLQNITEIGPNTAGDSIGNTWTVSNRVTGTTVNSVPNIWNGAGTNGARVCKQYVDGVLTTTPLWPWPMDARIRAALTKAGKNPDAVFGGTGNSVTQQMEALFGTIPAECRTSGTLATSIPSGPVNLVVQKP